MLKVNLSSFDTACVENSTWEEGHRLTLLALKRIKKESSFDTACVETKNLRASPVRMPPSSFDTACVETLCLNPRSIKRETYEFAVDRQLCKNALQIDSKVSM